MKKVIDVPVAKKKWEAIFTDITTVDWSCFYFTPWRSMSDSKIQYFQYKFLHRILPTNRLLSLMGKTDDIYCTFCKTEVETIDHLFWECRFTSCFILDAEYMFLKKQFFFSKRDYYFCYGSSRHPYNFLTMHMKKYIFDCKLKKKKPFINDFFYHFKFSIRVAQMKKNPSKKNINFQDLERAFETCHDLFV